jgi:hypothetical protein
MMIIVVVASMGYRPRRAYLPYAAQWECFILDMISMLVVSMLGMEQ